MTAVCSRDPKKLAGDWRGIRGNFGPPGDADGPRRRQEVRPPRATARRPRHRPGRRLHPTHLHPATAIAALEAGKHVLVEKAIAPDAGGRRRHARGGGEGGQAADGGARAAVLPRVRLRGRGHPRRQLRQAARRRTSSASSPGRTGRPTSATPPRPAARPSTCTSTTRTSSAWSAACRAQVFSTGVVEGGRRRLPDDAVPLRPRRPGGVVLQRGRRPEGPAVRPRLRNLPGEGDAGLRVGRHAADRADRRRQGGAAEAGRRRRPDRGVRDGDSDGGGRRRRRARSRTCSAASWRATRWCCATRRSSRCGRGRR